MGNSICHVLGNNDIPRFPCHLKLGTSVAIDLSTSENKDGRLIEYYSVLYTVDGSTCDLKFERFVRDGNVRTLHFKLDDSKYSNFKKFILTIWVMETKLSLSSFRDMEWTKTNRTNDACGGLTETKVYLYGSGNRICLFVLECKNPRNITRSFASSRVDVDAVTVAHYFANSSGTAFNPTEAAVDMGLSVITKTSLSNGKLDTTVEGPVQHPSSALLYMFDQVHKTGIWKPEMCPHCNSIQRARMSWQSESEDSDSGSIPLRHHSSQQNGTSVTNGGRFRGNGNGCIINNSKIIYMTR